MPIRFRCAYCRQLMGIARRKAGTVVRCPTCGGQVVVPTPEDEPAPAPRGGGRPAAPGAVFDQDDFDAFLQPAAAPPEVYTPPPAAADSGAPAPPPGDYPGFDAPQPGAAGVFLTTGRLVVVFVVLVLFLVLSFFAGFLVGRLTAPKGDDAVAALPGR